jgi:hypothetical protein
LERILCFSVVRVPGRAKAIVMSFELSQAVSPGDFGRACGLLILLLSMALALIGLPALASDVGIDQTAVQQRQSSIESGQSERNQRATQNDGTALGAPLTAPSLCEALATAATTNGLPVDFFNRLIWQESRFKSDAISPKGARGIAQFMPETARVSGLENPFDPLEAIAKSGQLLRGLRDELGNLGLAAAAYNAGSGRVRDWLARRRPLPQETLAYVRVVTGRSVEEWTGGPTGPVAMPLVDVVPCNLTATGAMQPKPDASLSRPETIKRWGVEVVGGPTPAKALARYREWQSRYPAILTDREPHIVTRGIIGAMGAVRVRVDEDTRVGAEKLCAALKVAGTYCDVWRN